MTDQANTANTIPTGFELTKFHFKEKKDKGITIEPKRDSFEVSIPVATAQSIVDIIFSETETDERKEKLLTYLARLHNDEAYKAAQSQINAKLASFGDNVKAKVAYQLQASDIDTSKLDLWTLAYTEPAQRGAGKQFSDELIAEASKAFIDYGVANFKRADGRTATVQGVTNSADEIFKHKFKSSKSNKDTLKAFKSRLTVWFDSLDDARKNAYAGLTQHLIEKIDAYLNPKTESSIGKFDL